MSRNLAACPVPVPRSGIVFELATTEIITTLPPATQPTFAPSARPISPLSALRSPPPSPSLSHATPSSSTHSSPTVPLQPLHSHEPGKTWGTLEMRIFGVGRCPSFRSGWRTFSSLVTSMMRLQELAEKYGEQVWLLQNIARTAVRDVDPQVCFSVLQLCLDIARE